VTKRKEPRGSRRSQLSERQGYWLEHLRACGASGESIKSYAKRQGLSVHGLYAARKRLSQLGIQASTSSGSSVSFARVSAEVNPMQGSCWRVRFPNGTVVEWDVAPKGEQLESLLKSIVQLS
jgi:hypothetical protein